MHKFPHPKIPKFEYDYITDGIYIGTNQCCQTHFKKELLKKGVRADISMEKEKLDMPYGVDFFLWLPVIDGKAPKAEQFEIGVSALEKLVALKQKIIVHCKHGHGRAPTLVAAYLIKNKKMAPDAAVAFIKKRRKVVHLNELQKRSLIKFKEYNKL